MRSIARKRIRDGKRNLTTVYRREIWRAFKDVRKTMTPDCGYTLTDLHEAALWLMPE